MPDVEAAVVAMAAYGPGEPWDDPSRGYSRTIAAVLSAWDEGLTSPEERARLLGEFVFGAADTGPLTDAQEERLALMTLDWQIRVWLPKWLRLGGLEDHARAVEGLAEFTRPEQLAVEIPELVAAKNAAQANYDRVRLHVWSAEWGATRDAVWNGVWNEIWRAVWGAAWNAIWNAVWNAAMNAAQSTPDALAATVRDCQWSTQDCVRRMCAEARKMKRRGRRHGSFWGQLMGVAAMLKYTTCARWRERERT